MVEFAMHNAWLVPLLPALSFVIIIFLTKPWPKLSGLVTVAGMVLSCVVASFAAYGVFTNHAIAEKPLVYATRWFSMPGLNIDVVVQLDPTSAMMMFMVTLVASLI
ncbi:MAG: NADH-quinone oxidoreductase subunit L, partial [Firmicutes bacterium]|nr:NADH-quinone oxidoreductase subunit L [Bacillota bacterium]